tara:strand:+ start:599 stop:1378 length:780 start_codon:yes stop_codon:yes gene_type:complete
MNQNSIGFHEDRLFSQGEAKNLHGINARSYNNFSLDFCLDYLNKAENKNNTIIDIGCGWGGLIRELKKRIPNHSIETVGIEPIEDMAAVASLFADQILPFDVDTFINSEDNNNFIASANVVILSDVLEHLIDPWMTLNVLSSKMSLGSRIIISIPCISAIKSMRYIYNKGFSYRKSGIFDFTHLRFFTYADILELVNVSIRRPKKIDLQRNLCPESYEIIRDNKGPIDITPDMKLYVRDKSRVQHDLCTRGVIGAVDLF